MALFVLDRLSIDLYGLHRATQEFPPDCVHIPLLNKKSRKCAFSLGVNNTGKNSNIGFE